MKNQRDIIKLSSTGDGVLEQEYTVTRNKGQNTFADFVDKVIDQIPMQVTAKNMRTKYNFCTPHQPDDPLAVLKSRGLINIENTPVNSDDFSSQVDLTLYTEESRLGELVKVFSSTHRFKNGRLVYSTTQEACPELDEEIYKFNRWWKSQGDAKLKSIEKEPSFPYKYTRKKLCDILKDIRKQETIKRYETESRKPQLTHKSMSAVEMVHFRKITSPKNETQSPLAKKVIVKNKGVQTTCQPCCKTVIPKNISSNNNSLEQIKTHRDFQNETSEGKVTYHASWLHKSPRKSQRKNSSGLRNSRSCHDFSQIGFRNKLAPVVLANQLKPGVPCRHRHPIRLRPVPIHKLSSSFESEMNLTSSSSKQSTGHGDSFETANSKSFKHCIINKNSECIYPVEEDIECLDGPNWPGNPQGQDLNFCHMHGIQGPIKSTADFDDNLGNSSDNTSVCTVYHPAREDWISKEQDSSSDQQGQDEKQCHDKNQVKAIEIIPPSSSLMFCNKSLNRDSCSHCMCGQKYYSDEDYLGNNIRCCAKCHKKHQTGQELSIMTGIVTNYNKKEKVADEKYDSMKVIESFINEKALQEFGKRYEKCAGQSNHKDKSTAGRQNFYKDNSDCFERKSNRDNRTKM